MKKLGLSLCKEFIINSLLMSSFLLTYGAASAKILGKSEIKSMLQALGYILKYVPKCEMEQENTCQDKYAGGHKGTIFSTKDGYCAKQIRSKYNGKEVEFYTTLTKLCHAGSQAMKEICQFIPRYGGLCRHKKKIYCKMQNLKKNSFDGRLMQEVWALDMKVGRYTSSAASMKRSGASALTIAFWETVHFMQDKLFSSSNRYGFRYAGVSGHHVETIAPKHAIHKLNYYMKPKKVIRKFLGSDKTQNIRNCFANRLARLEATVNAEVFQHFHLVGASLLLTYDHRQAQPGKNDCNLFMIDFANSFYIQKSDPLSTARTSHLKYVRSFRHGITKLKQLFQTIPLRNSG